MASCHRHSPRGLNTQARGVDAGRQSRPRHDGETYGTRPLGILRIEFQWHVADAIGIGRSRRRTGLRGPMGRGEMVPLARSYGELNGVLSEMKNVARNNALLNARLATNELRFVEFGKELQKLSAAPPPPTNDVPASTPEPPSTPRP